MFKHSFDLYYYFHRPRVATRNMCACHLLPANPLTAMYARRTHGLLCAQRVRLSRVFLVAAWPRVVRVFLVAAGVCAPGRSSWSAAYPAYPRILGSNVCTCRPRGRGHLSLLVVVPTCHLVASLLVDVGAVLTCAPVVAYRFHRVHLSLLVVAYRFVVAIGSNVCTVAPRGASAYPAYPPVPTCTSVSGRGRVSCVSSGSNMCTCRSSWSQMRQRVSCAPVAPRGRERARILRVHLSLLVVASDSTCPASRSRRERVSRFPVPRGLSFQRDVLLPLGSNVLAGAYRFNVCTCRPRGRERVSS